MLIYCLKSNFNVVWKDFFSFTKQECQGILLLLVLVAGICIGKFFFFKKESVSDEKNIVQEQVFENRKEEKYFRGKESFSYQPNNEITIILKPFDPNSVDYSTFVSLGLKPYIAQNIIKYRNKGGKFKNSNDFRKIYGLSNDDFKRLKPYIEIKTEEQPIQTQQIVINDSISKILPLQEENIQIVKKQEKITLGTVIDINLADTADLKKIPFIGSVFALRIVKYRRLLGGFYSVEQLKEVHGLDNELFLKIAPYMTISENPDFQAIAINQSSLDKLKSHPYINFYQAKVIIELRKKKGKIRDISELALLEEFSENDLNRLVYYLSFE